MTLVSKDWRVEVTISLARTTWLMEDRERLDARRWETRVSSGVEAGEAGEAEGGGRLSVEESILGSKKTSD